MNVQTTLSGVQKAAIFTMLVGEEGSLEVLKCLRDDEVEAIALEVAVFGVVQPSASEQVLEEFHSTVLAAATIAQGGMDYARKLLIKSLGPEAASRIIDRVARSYQSAAGFATLARTDPHQLSKFVLSEQPQTIALILAQLNPSHAAQLVALLPDELRAEVLTRMAALSEISPEVITRVSTVIEQRLKTIGSASHESAGGVRAVAELLNRLERTISQSVLEMVEADSPDLAVSIRNLMFVFDDLLQVEDNALREIVQRVDRKALPLALKGASEEIRERFFSNMSKRAGDMLREEMEVLGAVRLREVEQAQQEVVAIARKLEEEGLLTTGAAAGEAYVV